MTMTPEQTRQIAVTAVLGVVLGASVQAKTVNIEPNFAGDSATIDNPYWPLPVGYRFGYKAVAEDECEYNLMTVTKKTRSIQGVVARVVRDQEWVADINAEDDCDLETAELVEDTLDFYAQDVHGNVWYLGEDTWSFDDELGACTQEGSWLVGEPADDPEVEPAQPGIIMLFSPQSGDRYQQEYLEDEAEDWASVVQLNASVSIGLGDFSDCLKTKEWSPLEPGSVEHKYYCPPANTGLAAGLLFIEELKETTLHVEYVGDEFPADLPGEGSKKFPSKELVCD